MNDIVRQAQILSDLTADYRVPPSPEHVVRWVRQFDEGVRLPILQELTHVLNNTYFSLDKVRTFLTSLSQSNKIGGNDPANFWTNVKFLNIQAGGGSQKEMLVLFSDILMSEFGFDTSQTGDGSTTFAYIDDAIFTGGRVRADLIKWIENDAPASAEVHIIVIAIHTGSQYYVNKMINETISKSGKKIKIKFWRAIELEDQKRFTHRSDVLRPTECPNDDLVKSYVNELKYGVDWRRPGNVGTLKLFSSDEKRQILEAEFLKAGAKIRDICPLLGKYQRPLGNMVLQTLGFGSLIVTFRNCPNNAPLALWAGDPWIPLFPRTTNSDTEVQKFIKSIKKL